MSDIFSRGVILSGFNSAGSLANSSVETKAFAPFVEISNLTVTKLPLSEVTVDKSLKILVNL